MRTQLATALALAVLTVAGHASAADTASFGVQLVVQNACNITAGGTAADMDFGTTISNIPAAIDRTTNLSVTCSNGAAYRIGLGNGANESAGQRRMANGANFANYDLFRDDTRTAPWGALSTANALVGTGNGSLQSIPVYGRVPVQNGLVAGTYNDIVTATIEY
ncbi:MAG TPA: spore coat U domain-containing protein [Gammaproteobacteria bacterium]|nr:spore coat U domain-containing protein [Gammaproteobacteria bacterium]